MSEKSFCNFGEHFRLPVKENKERALKSLKFQLADKIRIRIKNEKLRIKMKTCFNL